MAVGLAGINQWDETKNWHSSSLRLAMANSKPDCGHATRFIRVETPKEMPP